MGRRFDSGDDTWLKMSGAYGEWAVAYHGTNADKGLPGIAKAGKYEITAGERQRFKGSNCKRNPGVKVGLGTYCAPLISTAEAYCKNDATIRTKGGVVKFKVAFMCRVKPAAIRQPEDHDSYWVINSPQDMRPYRILLKKCTC